MDEREARQSVERLKQSFGDNYQRLIGDALAKAILERDTEMIDYWTSLKEFS
jgi:hypothetical protein